MITIVSRVLPLALLFAWAPRAAADAGEVLSHQKISNTEGGGNINLDKDDQFGRSIALIGDLDGDGVQDIVVGAHGDDDGGNTIVSNAGAVWILFLNPDGTVKGKQKISRTRGNFFGDIEDRDQFGRSVGSLGDFDGDGLPDILVGSAFDDDGGLRRGAFFLLLLNADGTVKSHQKISDTQGNFTGVLDDDDHFGRAVDAIGDLDGDGVTDLVVGAAFDDDGGQIGLLSNRGAVWILFMNADGTVKAHQKISSTEGNFTGILHDLDAFGVSACGIGDLDGDGVPDVAVGSPKSGDGGFRRGSVWVLFLNTDGTVKAHQKISDHQGNFQVQFFGADEFGTSVTALGDIDGDGVTDLASGAILDREVGMDRGAAYVLLMNSNGTVKDFQKINEANGGFTGELGDNDWFGSAIEGLGDLDGDGRLDLAVGARFDDDGGANRGAAWILFLDGEQVVPPRAKSTRYGCGLNPEDSLSILAGAPVPGTDVVFGIDNPLGTQSAGSLPILVLSLAPNANFPCGRVLQDLGMNGPGELLINLGVNFRLRPFLIGSPWAGAGMPAEVSVSIPDDPALLGLSVFAQGVLRDASQTPAKLGLTAAYRLDIGL